MSAQVVLSLSILCYIYVAGCLNNQTIVCKYCRVLLLLLSKFTSSIYPTPPPQLSYSLNKFTGMFKREKTHITDSKLLIFNISFVDQFNLKDSIFRWHNSFRQQNLLLKYFRLISEEPVKTLFHILTLQFDTGSRKLYFTIVHYLVLYRYYNRCNMTYF